jgi:hypothetical protein
MSYDVSTLGLVLGVNASVTFPVGFVIDTFADNADPLDIPEITILDEAMGSNGDLITWAKAVVIMIKVAVIPNSSDDDNLAILLEANRVGRGKNSARDIITMIGTYANGRTLTLTGGHIKAGMPATSAASDGRLKTKVYSFVFENLAKTFI